MGGGGGCVWGGGGGGGTLCGSDFQPAVRVLLVVSGSLSYLCVISFVSQL